MEWLNPKADAVRPRIIPFIALLPYSDSLVLIRTTTTTVLSPLCIALLIDDYNNSARDWFLGIESKAIEPAEPVAEIAVETSTPSLLPLLVAAQTGERE